MYTFDLTSDDASDTYLEVCSAYQRIFKRLNVPVLKGKALVYYCPKRLLTQY